MKALKAHDLNFYERYREDPRKKEKTRKAFAYSFPVILLMLILCGAVWLLLMKREELRDEINGRRQLIGSEEIIGKASEAEMYGSRVIIVDNEIKGLEEFKKIRDSYPVTGTNEIESIIACCDEDMTVSGISFNMESGIVSFNINLSHVEEVPGYIRRLKDTELFESVSYEGYLGEGDYSTGAVYSVKAVMKRDKIMADSEFEKQKEQKNN